MPLIRSSAPVALAFCLLLFQGCGLERGPNRYQVSNSGSLEARPVNTLQQQALEALDQGNFQFAIDTLQRAIKIQPRNGWSWYYLADVHWRQHLHLDNRT